MAILSERMLLMIATACVLIECAEMTGHHQQGGRSTKRMLERWQMIRRPARGPPETKAAVVQQWFKALYLESQTSLPSATPSLSPVTPMPSSEPSQPSSQPTVAQSLGPVASPNLDQPDISGAESSPPPTYNAELSMPSIDALQSRIPTTQSPQYPSKIHSPRPSSQLQFVPSSLGQPNGSVEQIPISAASPLDSPSPQPTDRRIPLWVPLQ